MVGVDPGFGKGRQSPRLDEDPPQARGSERPAPGRHAVPQRGHDRRLENAIARYQDIVAAGGWPQIPATA
jgi:hypothetical protein